VDIVGIYRPSILAVPYLEEFLRPWGKPTDIRGGVPRGAELTAIAGWGIKPLTERPRREAKRRGIPFLALEDGFLHSIPTGDGRPPTWSLIVDPVGLFYDSSGPSRLEELIAEARASERTAEFIALFREHRLSKYNDAPDLADAGRLAPPDRPVVIVIDQTLGDWSVVHGGATQATFTRMLEAARDENPDADIVVRVHPAMLSRGQRGHLLDEARLRNVRIFDERASFGSVAARAKRVYTVTSLAGLEALMLGVPVTCFGRAFYGGWGLTDDRVAFERRAARPSLEALVAAAYERYPRYVDPVHGKSCDALTLARRLAAARDGEKELAGDALVMGVNRWKRSFIRPFVATPRAAVTYRRKASLGALDDARRGNMRVHVWAAREPPWLAAATAQAGLTLTRIEDGFLRSVGLGSNFLPALSLVLDSNGIYFDPSRPSGVERLLNDAAFPSDALRCAAQSLRARLVAQGLTKYNVGGEERKFQRNGKRTILVPGQIEDDQSVLRGSPRLKRNLDLLAAVRAAAPDATILYKPHPEIEAGNRRGALPESEALRYADRVLTGWDMRSVLGGVDEVHTMTSLTGFEALLRGIPVTVYGLPFYAGLGLTNDRVPWPRPRRPVDLDALTAAVLLTYPRYRDPATNLPVSAFDVLDILERQRATARPAREPVARAIRWIRLTTNL
jgi:capsular polysaccharide export protein